MITVRTKRAFTLIETMIAAAILAGAVAATMAILGSARVSVLQAERRLVESNALSNAAEFYLLGGPNAPLPENEVQLLPEGWSASCQVSSLEDLEDETLEEVAMEANNGWVLCEYQIELLDQEEKSRGSLKIRKILKEEDVEE